LEQVKQFFRTQETSGGQWSLLGAFDLSPGQNHLIVLTDEAKGLVVADAGS
jgi:hypothetical protein